MADVRKYQTDELLNKVLNSGGDALKVDIDNVTLTTEGGDVAIDVSLDKANDSVTIYLHQNLHYLLQQFHRQKREQMHHYLLI